MRVILPPVVGDALLTQPVERLLDSDAFAIVWAAAEQDWPT